MVCFEKIHIGVFSFLLLLLIALNHCGVPVCDDMDCGEGKACIEKNYEAVCVNTGTSGGGSRAGNKKGGVCRNDSDCAKDLICEEDLHGNKVCSPSGLGVGESCRMNSDCKDNLVCNQQNVCSGR